MVVVVFIVIVLIIVLITVAFYKRSKDTNLNPDEYNIMIIDHYNTYITFVYMFNLLLLLLLLGTNYCNTNSSLQILYY